MIDIETIRFIGKLNTFAALTKDNQEVYPFYAKNKVLAEKRRNDVPGWQDLIVYDDKEPADETSEWSGYTLYPMVGSWLIDDCHNEICYNHDNVFVCIPDDEEEAPFLAVRTVDVDAWRNNGCSDAWFSIENGEWHVAK